MEIEIFIDGELNNDQWAIFLENIGGTVVTARTGMDEIHFIIPSIDNSGKIGDSTVFIEDARRTPCTLVQG